MPEFSWDLDRPTARKLTVQTVLGAAIMAASMDAHLGDLKDMITSPGGTTIAGLHVLETCRTPGYLDGYRYGCY